MNIRNRCKVICDGKWLIPAMIIASLIKVLLVQSLPIYAITYAVHDDRLMVNMAQSIAAGEWLGPYNQMTLVKGIMYPLFLVVCEKMGIPYLLGVALTYVFSCAVLIYVLGKVIKNKIGLFCIYIFLLFDPVTMSLHAFQRVYRCALTPAHVIFLIACFFAMYLSRKECKKKMVFWAMLAGIALGVMWNTREDGIWVLPFVVGVIGVSVFKIIVEKRDKKETGIRIGVSVLPLLVFVAINSLISLINYSYYGIYTTNELSGSSYSDFMKAIYSVEPEEDIDYVSVPRETMDRIYEVSPTLKSIQQNIDTTLDAWEIHGKVIGDREVEHGWLFWALRDAVAASGYYKDAKCADEFYRTVADEIEHALDEGALKRRGIMPSVLMAPWKSDYFSELFIQLPMTFTSISTYEGVTANVEQSTGDFSGIRLYESITNNLAVYPEKKTVSISGWMFAKDDKEFLEVNLVDKNYNKVQTISFNESLGIYDYFITEFQTSYERAKKCRFTVNISDLQEDVSSMQIEVVKSDGAKFYYGIWSGEDEEMYICIDLIDVTSNQDIYAVNSQNKVDLINKIITIYRTVNPIVFFLGLIGYVCITVLYMVGLKRKEKKLEEQWLFLSGVLGSLIVLAGGLTYTHISAYSAINPLYLSGAYPLCNMFGMVSLVTMCGVLKEKLSKHEKEEKCIDGKGEGICNMIK